MSEMIERVAWAIMGALDPDAGHETSLKAARAAIEAMREPDEAMVEAAWSSTERASTDERMAMELCDSKSAFLLKMARRYRAMIDAALK